MLSVLMSAVVVAMAARDFAVRRLDDGALLRVLGVSQRAMLAAYVLELLLVALLAGMAGLLLGGVFHQVFVWLLADLMQVTLPLPGWWPLLSGMAVAVVLTLGFGLSPLIQLSQVPALRVLRRDLGQPNALAALSWVLGLAATALVLTITVGQAKLAAIALGGVLVTLLVLVGLSTVLLLSLRRWLSQPSAQRWPMVWRHAAQALVAQPAMTVTQLCALTLGLLAIFLLVLIRGDLIDSWRQATPPDAPDRFVINIQPDQADLFKKMLRDAGVSRYDWYPMSRARLLAINGKPVHADQFKDERTQRLVEREFNLSYAPNMPSHNTLTAGNYVTTAEPSHEMSFEQGIADSLGVKVGDQLSFDMAGQTMSWRITSLRKVNWASMRVNFFAMVPATDVQGWPVTYISAFRQPKTSALPKPTLDQQLVRQFPNVTVVDVAQSLAQVQGVLNQVIAAVEFLFAFTLGAGVLILLAGLWSSREQRAQALGVMRALGASRQHLQRVLQIELMALGGLAGLLASAAALAIGAALAWQVFEFPWQPPWWGPLAGVACGAALVLLAGWWSLRSLLQRPVMRTLRGAMG
jgi:putative ABC transport system permease protein